MFGKQDSDTKEDFRDLFDFDEAFLKPFTPHRIRRMAVANPEQEAERSAG